MIVKIIPPKANGVFGAVKYNTGKVDINRGELMRVANFGPLHGFNNIRPQDYINYLQMVAKQNKHIKNPQFHVAISGKQKLYDKLALTRIAEDWMKEMGYANQPYLIVFHKDTAHNHVHIVSLRVNKEGKKISSAFEHVRSQKSINKVLGYEYAFRYRFSTRAQFMMLLENKGYLGRDPDEQKILEVIERHVPDRSRINELRVLFHRYLGHTDFESILHEKHQIDLMFHSAEGKNPYGYSVIDHEGKHVFKGSEIMPLKSLLQNSPQVIHATTSVHPATAAEISYVPQVWIADDIDDQQILGMKRRRQKRAGTNTR
jgi:hypothetical protein